MSYEEVVHRCTGCEDIHKAFTNPRCDSCDITLKAHRSADLHNLENTKYLQFEDALHIIFAGGYNEFVDTSEVIGASDIHLILCHDCARVFFETNPWMIRFMPEYVRDRLQKQGRIDDKFFTLFPYDG